MIFQLRCRNLGTSSNRDFRASTSIQNVCTKTHTYRFVGDATIFLIVALHLGCCWTWFETVYRERPQYQALKSDVSYVESWSLYFLIYFCFTWFSLVHSFIFLYSSAVIVLLMCLSFFFFFCNEAWRFHGDPNKYHLIMQAGSIIDVSENWAGNFLSFISKKYHL